MNDSQSRKKRTRKATIVDGADALAALHRSHGLAARSLAWMVSEQTRGEFSGIDVKDPDNQAKLASLNPGQVMQFTYTEAMAVSVTPAGK